jgi:hypothetical protein
VLSQRFDWGGRTLLVMHNFADQPKKARLRLDDGENWDGVSVVFGEVDAATLRDGVVEVDLDPYGYCWLRVRRPGQRLLP